MTIIAEDDGDGQVLYVKFDDKRIAKRRSGQNWTILELGYKVVGAKPGSSYDSIEVSYSPVSEH